GYNEPDKSDQSNIAYADAFAVQAQFYQSGLRVTSPCTSDFYNWWGQAQYITDCQNMNYRIDISNVHADNRGHRHSIIKSCTCLFMILDNTLCIIVCKDNINNKFITLLNYSN
ncbi:hypothetical protein LJB91_01385, partial [Bacteroidales bacterium OttesenSCG-928-L03]|nr:hypothetical protein [Bacteroidales bacterium OttesenSCG-928-L03]